MKTWYWTRPHLRPQGEAGRERMVDNHRCPTHRSPSPGHHLVITVSHPHIERPSDLSVSAIQPWLLAMMVAAAAASVALVAGPVSAGARDGVRPLATNEQPTPSGDAGGKEPPASPATRTPKHPGLLESRPQALVALALCSWCMWWGVRAGAVGPTLVALPVFALLGCAAGVDSVAHLLPNRILGSITAWLLVCGAAAAAWRSEHIHSAWRALLLMAVAGGTSLALAFLGTGMGMGDVKLCAVIGLWLGWHNPWMLAYGFMMGILIAGIVALVLLATGRVTRKDSIAYGPYLIAGALLAWPAAIM